MHRLLVVAATAATCCTLIACGTPSHSPVGLVISDVTIVSPERASPLEHAYVRVLEGKIVEVSTRPMRGEHEIDGAGRYLIPGLIDTHVHLAVSPGFPSAMTAAQADAHPNVVAAVLAQDPKSYLFHGFTAVLDLVGSAERTKQWNALELRPDAYFCAAAVIVKSEIRTAPFPYFSYDVPSDERMPVITDTTQRTPEAIVSRIAADGASCVKTVYDSYAAMTPTVDELKALVAAAHARDLPVFIHANRKRTQGIAVAAGIDVIAHGMWRDRDEKPELDDEARDILTAAARAGIGYQPTTRVIAGELDMLDAEYLTRSDVADAYPAAFIDWCQREKQNCGLARFRNNSQERLRGTIDRASQVTRMLAEANARLLFGSDTPSDMLYTNPPGLNGRREMDQWIAAGVSDEKLFRAMTIDNARILRLDKKIGTIEPDKMANLLLLRANPLENVTAYDTIETVFLHGRPIPRAELSARNAPRAVHER